MTLAHSDTQGGPVRILCDEIGFTFDRRLERPEVLVAFVRELLIEVQHRHDMAVSISDLTGKKPPEETAQALALAHVMLAAPLNEMAGVASSVHDLSDQLNPEDAYPTNHTIDMVSSCASAIRFGLESPCSSRHAAAAASHVWKHVYGVSLFDRHTPAWEKEWARSKLQSAIISLLPAVTTPPAETGSPGMSGANETQGEAS